MGNIKRAIVVKNEFTTNNGNGKGSRGATPGKFVTRYMARPLATETLTPIRRTSIEPFIMRYMARKEAAESCRSVGEMKEQMADAQGDGGVAFGYGQVSLSDDELQMASEDIQRLFDQGHTVMKTVVSFDQDYLVEHGIVEPDFECKQRGDYRGNIDQMKLRMALMHGLSRMGTQYDDLRYVGVIQVDTEHVHCHLAMVDAGKGRMASDGKQRGKIDDRSKSLLRRGTNAWLDDKSQVAHLSSAVGYERRNVASFVKRWAHQEILKEQLPQFIIATLPEDRSLWRAGTNDRRMARANHLVTRLVEASLERPGSPMPQAVGAIEEYANKRRREEGLDKGQRDALVVKGRRDIIDGSVNGIYQMLRSVPDDELVVQTPLMSSLALDYDELVAQASSQDTTSLLEFGVKLRSHSRRLNHHRKERQKYHENVRTWEAAEQAGMTRDSSRALYEFYLQEEEYQARCAAKYQHLLPVAGHDVEWDDEWDAVVDYGERLVALEMMANDRSLRQMKDVDEAEARGRFIYGQPGGGFLTKGEQGRAVIADRAARMRVNYETRLRDLQARLSGEGLRLDPQELGEGAMTTEGRVDVSGVVPTPRVSSKPEYDFASTRALDIHHMRMDSLKDMPVGPKALQSYSDATQRRARTLAGAVAYLEGTGQSEHVSDLPVADVRNMVAMAEQLRADPVVHSERARLVREKAITKRSKTVRLGNDIAHEAEMLVDDHVAQYVHQLGVPAGALPAPGRDRSA